MRAVGIITVYLVSAAVSLAALAMVVASWGFAALGLAAIVVAVCAVPRRTVGDCIVIAPTDQSDQPLALDPTVRDGHAADRTKKARQSVPS